MCSCFGHLVCSQLVSRIVWWHEISELFFKHKARVTKTHKLVDGRCWHFFFVRSTKCANKPARLSYTTSRCEHKVLCCRYICTNIGVVFFKAPRRQDHQAVRPVSISAFSWLYVFLCEVSVWFFFVCANLDTTNNFFLLAI